MGCGFSDVYDVKCSRETDLKFGAVSAEQVSEFSVNGFFGPGDETSPVVLEVFPDDFDEIEFGAVRRKIEQECLVLKEPAVQRILIDAVMDARVVEHDHGGATITLADQRIEKFDNIGAFHGLGACRMDEAVLAEVQRPYDVAAAMMVGLDGMGQATW